MTGITYPTVTADGKEYTLRVSLRAECILSSLRPAISLDDLYPLGAPERKWQRMQIFAAAVADQFPDPAKAPNAWAWSAKIARAEWAVIDAALDEALKKVAEEWKTATPQTGLAAVG